MLLAAPWRQSAPERAASANTLPRLELGSQVRPGVRVVSGPEAVLAGLIRDMRLEPRRARQRRAVREIRSQAEMIYGGACEVCGSVVLLEWHHPNGDGAEHREREDAKAMYRRIVKLGRRLDDVELQLLCRTHHRAAERARERPICAGVRSNGEPCGNVVPEAGGLCYAHRQQPG